MMNQRLFCRSFVISLILLVSTSSIIILNVVAQDEDSWISLAPMQEARGGLGVAVVNEKIYAIGGYTGADYLNIIEEYDPTTDTWSYKASMPTPMAFFGLTVYNNKIYCISGENGAVEVYNPLLDSWEIKTSLPDPREGLKANTIGGKIYVVGGATNILNVYDIQTDIWSRKANITKSPALNWGWSCASTSVNDKLHVIGAFPLENSHQIYDPITDEWSFGEPCLRSYFWACSGISSGVNSPIRLFVFGGDTRWWPNGVVGFTGQFYDPFTKSWTSIDSPLTGRLNSAVGMLNGEVYVIGGFVPWLGDNWSTSAINEKYTPIGYGTQDPNYIQPTPTPSIEPTPTPSPEPEPFPTTIALASVFILSIVVVGILAYFKKYRK